MATERKAYTKEMLVMILKRAGSRTVSRETLDADIAAGAPVNADGTMSLVKYAAWILKTEASRAG